MPGKNTRKIYAEDAYYHVYNRGVNKDPIFRDDEDYRVFLNLFKRLLSKEPQKDPFGRQLQNINGTIELNAFCLMPNHFHMLVYQHTTTAITKLLQSVSTSYAMYFNKKYDRVGPIFQNRFRASLIDNDEYYQYISCYIHLNPSNYQEWKYSSLGYFLDRQHADWIQPERILDQIGGSKNYLSKLQNFSDYKRFAGPGPAN